MMRFLLPLYLLLAVAVTANAETLTGKVIGVTDGDTIKVLVAHRKNKQRFPHLR